MHVQDVHSAVIVSRGQLPCSHAHARVHRLNTQTPAQSLPTHDHSRTQRADTEPVHGEHCVGVCVGHKPACSRRGCARRVSARCQLSCKKTPPFPSKHRGDERNGAAAQNRSDVRAFVLESMPACVPARVLCVRAWASRWVYKRAREFPTHLPPNAPMRPE